MSGLSRCRTIRAKRRPPCSGFTLAEVLLSTAIMGILMTGVASAILIASRALPDPSTPTEALLRSSGAAEQMASELYCALNFTERTSTSVEFNVPDRDADLAPETIRYAWSGTPGDPLTRQYNGGTLVEVLDDVHEFSLSYDLTTATEQPDPVANESAEYLLSSHDTPSSPADFAMTSKLWIGQYFFPSLPLETIEWRVTRVLFSARIHGANGGVVAVQLRTPDASNLPGTTVLEETLMYESSLGAEYLWEEFLFNGVSGLPPTDGLCLVLAMNQRDTHLADIQYDLAGGAGLLTTSDGGRTWLSNAGQSMLYYVYGTATTLTTPDPITREWLHSVGIRLRAGADSATAIETATQVLNEPEVAAP